MRAKKIILFLFTALLLFAENASAQELYFRAVSADNNGHFSHIYKILQDKQGFVWLGTDAGLFRFDGVYFKSFATEKNTVTSLFQDNSLKIWQGFKNGEISFLKNGKNTIFSPEEGLPKAAITAIAQGKEKRIWFATYGEGLYYFYKNRLYNINTDDGLADNFTYDLAADNFGNIWAATDRGISKIHIAPGKKMVQNINQNHGLPDNLVTALCISGNTLFIGTQSQGLCSFDIEKNRIISTSQNWQFGQINKIIYNSSGLFAGTESNGFLHLNAENFELLHNYNRNEILDINKITDLLQDAEGNLWLCGGTENMALAYTDLLLLPLKNHNNLKAIRGIAKVADNYWLGTENGVYIYDVSKKWLSEAPIPQLKNINISTATKVGNTLWFGTLGSGIYIYDVAEKWFGHFTEKDGLVNNNILSFTQKNGIVYIATLGGAASAKIENKKPVFRNFSRKNGLPADYIYQVFEDKKGNIWFATDGKGLLKYSDGKYTIYGAAQGFPAKSAISITEAENLIWIGTADAGLFSFDGKTFKKQNIDNSKSYSIRALLYDDAGNLLIVHKNGLDILNIETGNIKKYGQQIGLQESDPELNAFAKNENGDVLLALGKTIIQYQKNTAQKNGKPQTRITDISLFLNPLISEKNDFKYNENHISFSYIGLWFHNPAEVNYRIKLDGYDLQWVNTRDHAITYPNLPPGKYIFRVKSAATEDFSGASEATYAFVISAPIWKRAWFYIPLFFLLAGSIYFYIRQREKMINKRAAIARENIEFQYETLRSQVNPHFLFNSFNTLAGIIETNQKLAVEYVEQLADFFRNLLVYKDKSVISLDEEIELLNNYFFLQKKRFGENLHLEIIVDEKYKKYKIPPLCLQLLIENAIKHNIISKDKPLYISIVNKEDKLIVQNHFQPKAYMEKSAGIGLANIKSRYGLLTKSEIRITQTKDFFEVELPLLDL